MPFYFCFYFCPFSVRWPTSHFIHKSPAPPHSWGQSLQRSKVKSRHRQARLDLRRIHARAGDIAIHICKSAHTTKKGGKKTRFAAAVKLRGVNANDLVKVERTERTAVSFSCTCYGVLLPFSLFCFVFFFILFYVFFFCDFVIAHI